MADMRAKSALGLCTGREALDSALAGASAATPSLSESIHVAASTRICGQTSEAPSSQFEAYTLDGGGRSVAGGALTLQASGTCLREDEGAPSPYSLLHFPPIDGVGVYATATQRKACGGGAAASRKVSCTRGVGNGKPPARMAPPVLLLLAGLPGSGVVFGL